MELDYKEFNFELKAVSDEGTFEGYASTFDGQPDLGGDIVQKGAFVETIAQGGIFKNGIRMLKNHDRNIVLGIWPDLHEDNKGLYNRGQLAIKTDEGHDVHELMKLKAINSESIGYNASDYEIIDKGESRIRLLKKIDLAEISIVTFPMNVNANITSVKSAIEECKTPRELERALKEIGLSQKAAEYIVSICKRGFPAADSTKERPFLSILQSLQQVNAEFLVKRMIWETEEKSVIGYTKYPLADEGMAWDGPAQIRKASPEDLKKICTWYDSAHADVKNSYKLPHHLVEGYKTVWRGVSAAMAAILGSRGGTDIPSGDRKGCYNHLKEHYSDFGKTAPEFKDYSDAEISEMERKGILCQ